MEGCELMPIVPRVSSVILENFCTFCNRTKKGSTNQAQRLQTAFITASDLNNMKRANQQLYIEPVPRGQRQSSVHSYWEGCGPGCVGYW